MFQPRSGLNLKVAYIKPFTSAYTIMTNLSLTKSFSSFKDFHSSKFLGYFLVNWLNTVIAKCIVFFGSAIVSIFWKYWDLENLKILKTYEMERSSHRRCSLKIGVRSATLLKRRFWRRCFFCEFCLIFKNMFFTENLQTTASGRSEITVL